MCFKKKKRGVKMEILRNLVFIFAGIILTYGIYLLCRSSLKIKRIYFEITGENQIGYYYSSINSYSSVYLISNIKELLKCFSNFTKEELEEMGVNLENVLQNNTVLIEKISVENDFINFIKSKQFKQILKNNEISDDEFKNFVETNLKDFGYMKEKVEKLNTFIQEKQKIKFKKINNLSNEKI